MKYVDLKQNIRIVTDLKVRDLEGKPLTIVAYDCFGEADQAPYQVLRNDDFFDDNIVYYSLQELETFLAPEVIERLMHFLLVRGAMMLDKEMR